MVFPSNQSTRESSIPNIVCNVLLSRVNPYTIIPALLFLKYITAVRKESQMSYQECQVHGNATDLFPRAMPRK